MTKWLLLITVFVLARGLSSCGDEELTSVTVDLMDSNGKSIGIAESTEEDNGVRVKMNATGLPVGSHGIHFHEVGECEAPDFESAYGHFNPTGASHGMEQKEGPHADGTVEDEFLVEQVTRDSPFHPRRSGGWENPAVR
ncbi:superoxide dismutase family protein [Sporosarcina sp. E16_8]|uniref:superoxide dismutase family protein n=1 Tax=Sporosarcina sp. E16_8 TaxID=2789295 RepID=UPI0031F73126